MVDKFVTAKCHDAALAAQLRAQLILWRDNDAKLQPLMQRLGLLRAGVAAGRESIRVASCGHISQRKRKYGTFLHFLSEGTGGQWYRENKSHIFN
jgi:hypothetical protein